MTITFGRAGLATASGGDGLTLNDPTSLDFEGDTLKVQGDFQASTLADAKAMRDQLRGYDLNTDEPVIPFTWSGDSTVDGFYRVQNVSAGTVGQGSYIGSGWFEWEAELLRVPGWQAPLFEVVCSGADRVTGLAVTQAPWIGIPVQTAQLASATTWVTAHGTVYMAGTDYSGSLPFTATAATHYNGSCRIEASADSGATYRTVVGRQMSQVGTYWRVSNGIVRVEAIPSTGGIRVGYYDSPNWETVDFHLGIGGGGVFFSPVAWTGGQTTVNDNRSEVCTVRMSYLYPANAGFEGYVDFTVRRGAPWVDCVRVESNDQALSVYRTATEAATSITGGIQATSNNVSGNKFTIASPKATTKIVTGASGIHLSSPSTTMPFAVSPIVTTAPAGAGSIVADYFAAINHHQRVVSR